MKDIGLLILAFLALYSCNFKEDGIIKYDDLVNIYECDDRIYLCMRKNETYSIESFDKSVTIASELNFVPDLIFYNGNQFLFTKHYDSINSFIKIYDSAGNVKEKIEAEILLMNFNKIVFMKEIEGVTVLQTLPTTNNKKIPYDDVNVLEDKFGKEYIEVVSDYEVKYYDLDLNPIEKHSRDYDNRGIPEVGSIKSNHTIIDIIENQNKKIMYSAQSDEGEMFILNNKFERVFQIFRTNFIRMTVYNSESLYLFCIDSLEGKYIKVINF